MQFFISFYYLLDIFYMAYCELTVIMTPVVLRVVRLCKCVQYVKTLNYKIMTFITLKIPQSTNGQFRI
jgi:hypothetical protein